MALDLLIPKLALLQYLESTRFELTGEQLSRVFLENNWSEYFILQQALGELEDEKNLTLRNSIVGPDLHPEGIGLLNWFMQQEGEVDGYTKTIWTGQTTLQLARTMEAAALSRTHGLYNAVPDRSISKYELLKLFNRYLRNDAVTIRPAAGVRADKSLKRTRFDFDYRIPDYEQMIAELAAWMRAHKSMYPHYGL